MYSLKKIIPIGIVAGGIAAGVVLLPSQPVALTRVNLQPQKVYFATFAAPDGTIVKEPLTAKQYAALGEKDAQNPTKPGYTFTGAYEGQLYDTGKDFLDDKEYVLDGKGKAVISLGKETKAVADTFITNNVLSKAGVDEFRK